MHELGLAEGILAVVLDVAEQERVERVRVSVGALQRVTADSLRFHFEVAAQDTLAADAVLDVEEVAGAGASVDAVKLPSGWRRRPDARPAVAGET
jgi:hydrogenase nickel incorporation protein HypA/HybF